MITPNTQKPRQFIEYWQLVNEDKEVLRCEGIGLTFDSNKDKVLVVIEHSAYLALQAELEHWKNKSRQDRDEVVQVRRMVGEMKPERDRYKAAVDVMREGLKQYGPVGYAETAIAKADEILKGVL